MSIEYHYVGGSGVNSAPVSGIPAPGEYSEQISYDTQSLGASSPYSSPASRSYYTMGYPMYTGALPYVFPQTYTTYGYTGSENKPALTWRQTYAIPQEMAIGLGAPSNKTAAPMWYKDLLERDLNTKSPSPGSLANTSNAFGSVPTQKGSPSSSMGIRSGMTMVFPNSTVNGTAIPTQTRTYRI